MGVPIDIRREPPDPWSAGAEAQETWVARLRGRELARLSLWWRGTPPLPAERVGAIGGLTAAAEPGLVPAVEPAVTEAAAALLRHACRQLAEQGCSRVLAPMDGNTWNAYRCRLDPPAGFADEPVPGAEWLLPLRACGFREQARYVTSLCDDLESRRLTPRARRRLAGLQLSEGAGLDPLTLLPRLHGLVHRGFHAQPFFLPLSPAAFAQRLQPQLAADPGRLVLLAFEGQELVGLLLAHQAAQRLAVRTLVVLPGRSHAGLGALLLEEAQERARARGCTSALHTLMHARGPSLPLSRHYALPLCRYVLMGRGLGPGERG